MQVQNMRQKLLEQDQLQDSEKESLRRLRSQMKNLMRKKGIIPPLPPIPPASPLLLLLPEHSPIYPLSVVHAQCRVCDGSSVVSGPCTRYP